MSASMRATVFGIQKFGIKTLKSPWAATPFYARSSVALAVADLSIEVEARDR